MFFSETMLEGIENVVPIEMLHEVATDNMLKKFTTDTCQIQGDSWPGLSYLLSYRWV